MLHTLAEQPEPFVQRVLIASIESNLRKDVRSFFQEDGWHDSAETELRGREIWRSIASGPLRDKLTGHLAGGPLLVTVPYPTGILLPGAFAERRHRRPVTVLLYGNCEQGRRDGGNWIRPL
eukprot:gene730-9221_t